MGLSCILRMTQDPGSLARQISGVGYRGVCRAEMSVEEQQHRKCAGASTEGEGTQGKGWMGWWWSPPCQKGLGSRAERVVWPQREPRGPGAAW